MLALLGQGKNFREFPRVGGVSYNRASLDWRSKPWAYRRILDRIDRFEVRPGDKGYEGDYTSGNERSELVTKDQAAQGLFFPFDVDVWLSFGFLVEAGNALTMPWGIVGQMHDLHDSLDTIGLSPPLCFVIGGGSSSVGLTLQTRYDANRASTEQPTPTTRWSRTLPRGQWINLVCRQRYSYDGAAELQLWADGVEQINLSGISIGYNNGDGIAGYWQYGMYRGPGNADTVAVRYANTEQGTSSLLHRVANPMPIPDV